jgi:hypothetical protein
VGERLLHPDAQRGEEDGPFHALVVHDLQAGVAVLVLGMVGQPVEVAEQLGRVSAFRVAAPEVLVERARPGDRIPRRVRDEPVDATGHQQAFPAVHRRPLHGPLAVLRFDVAGERVLGFVVVVVAIEQPEIQVGHHRLLSGWQISGVTRR